MPIYEYRCGACGDEFEIIQRISEGPLERCDKCGGKLEKLLSRTAFLLKGGGWYADGYGGQGSKPKSGGADSGEGKGGSPAKGGKGASKREGGSAPQAQAASSSD